MLSLVAALIVFAAPDVRVNWVDREKTTIKIHVEEHDPLLKSCLQGGLGMRYRFETQICKRRRFWFDGCLRDQIETRTLYYDPITSQYQLTVDRHRDGREPATESFKSYEKAIDSLALVSSMPIEFVAENDEEYLGSSRAYLSVRAFSDCIGEGGEFLERVSSVLSLGLVEIHGFDTDWIDYQFRE
jgi:hypothetical protein